MTRHERLVKRLGPYWKMEAGNVLLVPAAMGFLANWQIGWITVLAVIPMQLLLVTGAVYWREKHRQLLGARHDPAPMLCWIARARKPLLGLTILGCLAAGAGWLMPGLTVSLADRLVASCAAVLAVLEFVNYYHWQLQHFDHWADFRRLCTGKGFRTSSMAKDLRALSRRDC